MDLMGHCSQCESDDCENGMGMGMECDCDCDCDCDCASLLVKGR